MEKLKNVAKIEKFQHIDELLQAVCKESGKRIELCETGSEESIRKAVIRCMGNLTNERRAFYIGELDKIFIKPGVSSIASYRGFS